MATFPMPKCSSLFWKYGTTEWKAVRQLGGINKDDLNEPSVEYFDTAEDKWIQKTTIPVKSISSADNSFIGCVLRLSKAALDELSSIEV